MPRARVGSPRHCLRKHGARGDVSGHELGQQRAGLTVSTGRDSHWRRPARCGTVRRGREENKARTRGRKHATTAAAGVLRGPPVPSSKSAASTISLTMPTLARPALLLTDRGPRRQKWKYTESNELFVAFFVCVCAGGTPPLGGRSARRAACFKATPAAYPRVDRGAARAHGGAGPGSRKARRRGGRRRRG